MMDGRPSPHEKPFTAARPEHEHARHQQQHGHSGLGQQAGGHADDRELRADRDVDLAGQDHERHPGGHDQHRRVVQGQVPEVGRAEEGGRSETDEHEDDGVGEGRRQLALVTAEP
jgi:hypothetical protein